MGSIVPEWNGLESAAEASASRPLELDVARIQGDSWPHGRHLSMVRAQIPPRLRVSLASNSLQNTAFRCEEFR